MIIILEGNDSPDIPHIVSQFRGAVTKQIRRIYPNADVWQRSYYDHIIRNQKSYEQIWAYIEGNPQNWEKDDYYLAN